MIDIKDKMIVSKNGWELYFKKISLGIYGEEGFVSSEYAVVVQKAPDNNYSFCEMVVDYEERDFESFKTKSVPFKATIQTYARPVECKDLVKIQSEISKIISAIEVFKGVMSVIDYENIFN